MNEKRFGTVQTRLLFVLAEANRHRIRITGSAAPNAKSDLTVLSQVELVAADMWRGLFGALRGTNDATAVKPTARSYQEFRECCLQRSPYPGWQTLMEEAVLRHGEELVGLCECLVKAKFPLRRGVNLSDDGIRYGVFVNHPWYRFGPLTWHRDEADALHNAAITNGKVATVRRDQDGHYEVPLEERLALGVTSSAV